MAEARIATKTINLPGGSSIEAPSDWTEQDALLWARDNAPGIYDLALSPSGAKTAPRPLDPPTTTESFGGGMADVAMGGRQLLGLATPAEEAEYGRGVDLYNQARGPDAGIDWPRVAGQATATLPIAAVGAPGAKLGLLGRSAVGAAEGGLAGGLLYAPDTNTRIQNVALSGAGGLIGGAGLPLVSRAGESGVNAARRIGRMIRAPQIAMQIDSVAADAGIPLGELSDAVREGYKRQVAMAARQGGEVDPAAALRRARIEAAGFTDEAAPLRGQITRDPDVFSEEINLSKQPGGEALQSRYRAQDAVAENRINEIRQKYAGTDLAEDVSFEAGEAVEGAVQKRAAGWQKEVGDLYTAAREARPDATLSGDQLSANIGDVFERFRNAAPADLRRRVSELVDGNAITPEDLEQLDQLASTFKGDPSPAVRSVAGSVSKAARASMRDFGEQYGGEWKAAVSEAARRFKAIGKKGITARFHRAIQEPEKIVSQLSSGPIREIDRLRNFIAKESPQAWALARTSVWNDIARKAFPSGEFSQAGFNRAVATLGPRRLRAIFGEEGAKDIRELAQATRDLMAYPKRHSVNTSNSLNNLPGMFNRIGRVLSSVPLVAELGVGVQRGAQRAMDRRSVALALQALPGSPIKSPPIFPNVINPASRRVAPAAGLLSAQTYHQDR